MNLKKAAGAMGVGLGIVASERIKAPNGGLDAPGMASNAALAAGVAAGFALKNNDIAEGVGIASIALLAKNVLPKNWLSMKGGPGARGHSHSDGTELCELCVLKEREALGV